MARKIELLAPARDADCGIEAIRHGADAVYIGGPTFGARAAATNSVKDIARLCDEAHTFDARVYVTLNTILYEDELTEAERLIRTLYSLDVDALIVQDLGILQLDIPPIALHASTQMDNRTPEKTRWLEAQGFSQIVLARELSLNQIAAIRQATSVPLEAFVHGALCVSFSGQCYASQCCFGRSANRGNCAQFCRLSFDLIDGDGNTVIHDKHLLSLRDMNRSNDLESMMDAGVSSFKIEGRLKDVSYVKNVTAYYRQQLDRILARRPDEYIRSSYGQTALHFVPQVSKSFNRGFTDYYLHGRRGDEYCFDTPKATGEKVGRIRQSGHSSLTVAPDKGVTLAAGDGICYYDAKGELQGFRINRAEGNVIFPRPYVQLPAGTALFRNYDFDFEKRLAKSSADRKLQVRLKLSETQVGYALRITSESGHTACATVEAAKEPARTPQAEYIRTQLSKLGGTPFVAAEICIDLPAQRFLPASVLSDLRRRACEALLLELRKNVGRELRPVVRPYDGPAATETDYRANVANSKAAAQYRSMGVAHVDRAYELDPPGGAVIMYCRHCLRYALGACPQSATPKTLRMPLSLRLPDGRVFPLRFDCKNCQMLVYAPQRR